MAVPDKYIKIVATQLSLNFKWHLRFFFLVKKGDAFVSLFY
jgi:hypothetical protein